MLPACVITFLPVALHGDLELVTVFCHFTKDTHSDWGLVLLANAAAERDQKK